VPAVCLKVAETMIMTRLTDSIFAHTALVGVLLVGSVHGAHAQSLADALIKAYGTNPTLLSSRAAVRATDEGMAQALSGWRPSLSASGSTATRRSETSTTRTTTNTNPRSLDLSLSQSLYAGGTTMAAISSARHSIDAERARLTATEQTVLLAAATAYLNVFRDQSVVDLNIQNEHVLTRHLEATQNRYDVGEITRTDVHQAEARLAGSNSTRIQSEGTLESSRANYVNVIGEAPGNLEGITMPLNLPTTLDEAIRIAEENNPTVLAALFDEKVSEDSVSSTRGNLLPSVDLTGSANRSLDTTTSNYWSNSLEAKVTLSVPLYQSGTVYSQLRQARQTASAARLATLQARRDATEKVRTEWQNLQATRARIESIKTQVLASTTALEGVQREANVGSRTVLDVLDAEQELLNAQVNLVTSQRDEVVSALTLLSAVGKLTATDLNLSVDLYDADRHYQSVRGKWFGGEVGGNSK
jgi:TolC family type I secretion outer membrane protein